MSSQEGARPERRVLGVETELDQPMKRERRRHRTLTDGGGDTLGGAVADVACRGEAGPARLERKRVSVERPAAGARSTGGRTGLTLGTYVPGPTRRISHVTR
jgi:hypothetical protein